MFIISASYGNDSVAMIQWTHENNLKSFSPVHVVYCDTGWAHSSWSARIEAGERLAESYGFKCVRIGAINKFEQLMISKKGFPNQRYQWCSAHLKGIPFLDWIEEIDPQRRAWILIGKWSGESKMRMHIPSTIPHSEYHAGRFIWHPLNGEDRDALVGRSGLELLPHRSQECAPCVNANSQDFKVLTEAEIVRVENLEVQVGKTMFRPKRHKGAQGIRQVVAWAHRVKKKQIPEELDLCSHGMCGR